MNDTLIARRAAFRSALLRWYRAAARPLPWRTQPSPYRTVVSEFMLQQTQVRTVLPYFERWMSELPDFAALAAAPESRVLKLWEGLGYYSRARNLHRLARAVAAEASLPRTPEGWLELPGVGPYTAAAVSSIAFGAAAACVDGNVVRILTRLTADATPYRDSASAARALAPLARSLLSEENPGDHNQAMMELGATLCLRRAPLCGACPVRPTCAAAQAGEPEAFPRLSPKKTERIAVTRVWCERGDALLLHRAPRDSRRLAGQHELPTPAQAGLDEADVLRAPLLARKSRGITRFRIAESIHQAPPPKGRLPSDLAWVPLADLPKLTLSGPHRKWIDALLSLRRSGR
jgi:A/G-specific adenine glycosylase